MLNENIEEECEEAVVITVRNNQIDKHTKEEGEDIIKN